ncbi:uncharacterized protein LOC120628786 [Pararge aegeria]|uniref:uncharacterized protein LOC120628786 n=1 Tax=Pararge aegeria TaxID=116150 RepID=UPI0019D10B87|nr:uncharacterized protein LOC120628786 [Pararge aegeria]
MDAIFEKLEQDRHISSYNDGIIEHNLKTNGWNNIFFIGTLPNALFEKLKRLPFTSTVSDIDEHDEQIENVVPYHSNVIIINCLNFKEFEDAMTKTITLAYWHSLANIIVYYHAPYEKEVVAKIFFIFWYYRAINVVIVHCNDTDKTMMLTRFSPYISENYQLSNIFGCWTANKIGMSIKSFADSFVCVNNCHNVTLHSKLRSNNLGTCIGFETHSVSYEDVKEIQYLPLFEDKGKNLHGFTLRAFSIEVLPFLGIKEHENGTYTLYCRDGMIWNTMAALLNFSIDLSSGIDIMKEDFDFEVHIQRVFSFIQRKEDLILFPIYQFDIIIAEIEYTFPLIDSGVCFLSKRADYETIIFNAKLIQMNLSIIFQFVLCFLSTWFVFFIFNLEHFQKCSFDQAGKDLINTFRTVLSISIYNPPRRLSFRIFLSIAIWSFFVINFSTQAAIISLFSAHKRGKDVDTFEDVIEKGYKIQGMASPDVVLPETEEKYIIITSRMEAVPDMFTCVKQMLNDSHRFCIIDCANGRYLMRNMLDEKGQQFLHIATDARIHSHYLNMVLHKNSPLAEHFNKYMMRLFEAGMIWKWMEYRFKNIKEEVALEPLGMKEMEGIFKCYCLLVCLSFVFFLIEVLI